MSIGSDTLRLISGVGAKGPACFVIETAGKRLMLDLGEGPPPGFLPDVEGLGPLDALVLSHGHKDHVGGLSLLEKLGNPPVYATDIVARGLPKGLAVRPLPVGGTGEVLGIEVTTGRNGHAPGGVWLHFAIGDGFLYTGDWSAESILYAYDPPAETGGDRAARLLLRHLRQADRANAGTLWRRSSSAVRCCCRCRPTAAARKSRSNCCATVRPIFSSTRPWTRRCSNCAHRQHFGCAPTSTTTSRPRRRGTADRRAARRHARGVRRRHLRRHRATCSNDGSTQPNRRSSSPATCRPARPPTG